MQYPKCAKCLLGEVTHGERRTKRQGMGGGLTDAEGHPDHGAAKGKGIHGSALSLVPPRHYHPRLQIVLWEPTKVGSQPARSAAVELSGVGLVHLLLSTRTQTRYRSNQQHATASGQIESEAPMRQERCSHPRGMSHHHNSTQCEAYRVQCTSLWVQHSATSKCQFSKTSDVSGQIDHRSRLHRTTLGVRI